METSLHYDLFDLLKGRFTILFSVWFQKYGKIDILVCNAAANPSTDPILSTKEAVLDKLWEINVKSSILLLQVNKPFPCHLVMQNKVKVLALSLISGCGSSLREGFLGYLHNFHRWISTTRIHGYVWCH